MIVLYTEITMIYSCALAMVKWGYLLTSKFRKIKQFSAFWCILYSNQTAMKFTTNDSAARKQ